MRKIIFSFLIFYASSLSAQIGIGTSSPENSAILDVSAANKGLLLPRLTSAQRTAIASPANGLHVFDITTNSLWYFKGSVWINSVAAGSLGDVKSGFHLTDHSGWIKLDGRAVNSLNSNQQIAASSLGFTSNIPNASSAYLAQNSGSLGSVAGSNTSTLAQANLPNVSFNGSTDNAGGHAHTGTTDNGGIHSHNVYDPGHSHTQTTINDDYNSSGGNAPGFIADGAGSKTWSNINGTSTGVSLYDGGNHNHPFTTATNPNHSHGATASSGGSGTPINISPKSLTVNMFIYLGL